MIRPPLSRPLALPSLILSLALGALSGCNPIEENTARPQQAGEPCGETEACGGGLVCSASRVCVPFGDPGSAGVGGACEAAADCQTGLFCSGLGRCAQIRSGSPDDVCQGDAACRVGLICSHEGRCAAPGEPGTTPSSGACEESEDCAYNRVCGVDDTCTPIPISPGVECPARDPGATPQMLFEVPQVGGEAGPFFSLPFPNDVRRRGDQLDLFGYPAPTGADLVGTYTEALSYEGDRFGLNQAIVMRFNTNVDFSTLRFGGDDATLIFLDVSEEGASRGRRPRARFFATTGRTRYICNDWLALRPSEGSPLEPNRTYAIYLLQGVTDTDGRPLEASADLQATLGNDVPTDPALAAAWRQYAPLRSWLVEAGVPADQVIGATQFSTGDPTAPLATLPTVAAAQQEPELSDAVMCDGGVRSPCTGGGDRACSEANPLFTEIHGRLAVPDLIRGEPPYEAGGEVQLDAEGLPVVQGESEICVAVTVPKGEAPEAGWPVIVYAHEIDGHFKQFVLNGFAARMARRGYAVVSYDGVLHGGRRGADPDPGVPTAQRLAPFERPALMKGLRLQGAMDLHHLMRLLDGATQGPDDLVRFNPLDVSFFGDGLGGEIGSLFLAHTDRVRAAALTATGGQLFQIFLARQDEARHRETLQLALADEGLNGMHPALNLIQTYLDPVDPVNIGAALTYRRSRDLPLHLFMLYGAGDVRTPAEATASLAVAGRVPMLSPVLEDLDAVDVLEESATRGNVTVAGQPVTRAMKQYPVAAGEAAPGLAGEDAQADLDLFFESLQSDPEGVPTVGR